MDKKSKDLQPDESGFEEFIEGQSKDKGFLPKLTAANMTKKETSFEHFTFLSTDTERLSKLNRLLNDKLPFATKYEQGTVLINEQREEIHDLQKKIFEFCDKSDSTYRKSLQEIFDPFFAPHKPID